MVKHAFMLDYIKIIISSTGYLKEFRFYLAAKSGFIVTLRLYYGAYIVET